MSITSKSTLINWFKTGLKPLEAQFEAWLNSYWHKDEFIPEASVAGLTAALQGKQNSLSFTPENMQRFGLNTAGATITLDMQLFKEVAFVAALPITAVKTWSFANEGNAIAIPFVHFTIGTVADQTFPSNVTMALIVGDWNNTTKVWTPPAVGLYKASLNYSGSVWVMEITGPLY